eukprot:GFKZ01001273.1.p1 GENE.GFKZ01001273.1~~GFKZ01001273.1.p1  ORF type:complete len:409 (-),score=61.48 GFKZ01001273.1:1051-2277(-)
MHDPSILRRKAYTADMTRHLQRARSHQRSPYSTCCVTALGALLVFLLVSAVFVQGGLFRGHGHAKLAFFIQVSHVSLLQVPRLLRSIWHKNNVYVIHFDKKVHQERREQMVALLQEGNMGRSGNILVMDSEPVSYAGVSMLVNTLNAIELLLKKDGGWDYFINLSAQDYPLVSPSNLRRLFGMKGVREAAVNMLQRQEADKDLAWFFGRRIGRMHVDTALWDGWGAGSAVEEGGRLVEVNATFPVESGRIVKTEGWVILHRSFCEYAVGSAEARRLLMALATARAADELYFGTLLTRNKKFGQSVRWDGLRFVLWGMGGEKWSRPAFLDGFEGNEVRGRVAKSGALFARKFRETESEVMRFLDENVSGIAEREWQVDEGAVERYVGRAAARLLCSVRREGGCDKWGSM